MLQDATTILLIPVRSAHWTKPPAVRSANYLHGEGKQDLLPHHVGQIHAFSREKADLQFVVPDFNFFFPGNFFHGPIGQVEVRFNRQPYLLKATVAGRFESSGNMPLDSYFLTGQLSLGIHRQRFHLPEFRLLKIQHTGWVGF